MGGGSKTTVEKQEPYKGLPKWAKEYYKKDAKRGTELIEDTRGVARRLAANPQFVASMSPEERAALERVLAQGGESQALLGEAQAALGGDRYESEYLDDVVDTTLAGMRREAGRESTARGASEAAIGGLSGTRAAVADALAQQLTGMNMAQTEAGLRSDAERFAAEMGLQESGQLAALAGQGMDLATGEAQFQGTFGEQARKIAEREAEARRVAERDAFSWRTDIFNSTRGLPATQSSQRTTTQPGPSGLNQALGTAATVAGIWAALPSDERVKDDIEPDSGSALDRLRDVESYRYRYREGWGDPDRVTTGLMAQDLERSGIEGAVLRRGDGVRMVDPYPVLATITKAVRELDERTRPRRRRKREARG